MKPSHRKVLISLLFITAVLSSAVFYSALPDQMASHWNMNGEVDDYSPKLIGVLIGPLMLLIFMLFMVLIPHVDPLSENISHFRLYFDAFWVVMSAFIVYLHGLMIAANLGASFNMGQALLPAIAALWYFIGVLLKHSEPNWFVGIRTPWTLSDDRVWLDTHRIGGTLFKWSAALMLVSTLRPTYGFYIVLVSAIGISLFLIMYSYFAYRKLHVK